MNLRWTFVVVAFFCFVGCAAAQLSIPPGTVIPVRLNTTLSTAHARINGPVSARVMQDVSLPGGKKIRAGTKIYGHIADVHSGVQGRPAWISFTLDSLRFSRRKSIRLKIDLRAVAGVRAVSSAYLGKPSNGANSGVLVDVSANPQPQCRGSLGDNQRSQVFWVFSSGACGVYGMDGLRIVHAGRTPPLGLIRLDSDHQDLTVRSGSGMLLRVISADE